MKHRINEAKTDGAKLNLLRSVKRRLTGIDQGKKWGIGVQDDMRNLLAGYGGSQGLVAKLENETRGKEAPKANETEALIKSAEQSRQRVAELLKNNQMDQTQQSRLAQLMVWQNLAYQSGSLAHGSFAPDGPSDARVEALARKGLEAAIALSFQQGASFDKGEKPDWKHLQQLHVKGVEQIFKDLPEYWFVEPGQVRKLDMKSRFGAHWPQLHGENGLVGKMGAALREHAGKLKSSPIEYIAKALFNLHNWHPFRDGNGRAEVTHGWSLEKGAGFPLPIRYDQQSGEFKLAAAKWGGTETSLARFLANGALETEKFAKAFVGLTKGAKIVSNHTDHGAVGTVIQHKDGSKELLVMLPVNHATQWDPELRTEAKKNRAVVVADSVEANDIKLKIAINGRDNPWTEHAPATAVQWKERYPWWNTFEPIYRVKLPADAQYVNFKIHDPAGKQIGHTGGDYYMNLKDYTDVK